MSVSRDPEPDAIGPWSVLIAEVIDGAAAVLTAHGPMPRAGAEAMLDVLGLCAYDDPLEPFSVKVSEPDLTTLMRVSFGEGAVLDLLCGDRANEDDPMDRWQRAHEEVGGTLPLYPKEAR